MSPILKSLVFSLAMTTLLLATPAEARERRGSRPDSIRERVALEIVRLLPPQPRPARNFAPVPVSRAPQTISIWLDRELIWTGLEDQLQGAIETFPFDQLDPIAVLPPWDPGNGHEICVGVAIRAETDGHFDDDVYEIDCDIAPVR